MARERVFLLLIVFMLIANVRASVMINEVMPHPTSQYNEWVELYNTESNTIIFGGIIGDDQDNDTITNLIILPKGYALIVDNNIGCANFNIPNESCLELAAIGGYGLKDSGENLTLYDKNKSKIDNYTWISDPSVNISIGRHPDGGEWQLCSTPTPGTTNNCTSEQNQTQQNQTQQNQTQTQNSSNSTTQSQNTESSLSIIDSPSKATFGETIDVEITAYRGDTAKYAIYLYIKKDTDIVSEKVSIHLDNKFANYSFTVPLKIKSNCDASYDEGTYAVILEGLDKLALEDITLKGNVECESDESLKRGKVSYKTDFPDEIRVGKEFIVSVQIYNNQNKRQQFSVWSYVYRNNNCYSCGNKTREANAEQVILDKYESATLFLKNTAYNADEGIYNLKVKVLREGYETTKDFIFDIFVKSIPAQENKTIAESILNESAINESSEQSKITGKVVYQAEKKSPLTTLFLFIILCLLLLLYFMLKKKQHRSEGEGFERDEKKTETKKEAEAIGKEILKEDDFGEEELTESSELKGSEEKTEKPSEDEGIKTEFEKQEDGT